MVRVHNRVPMTRSLAARTAGLHSARRGFESHRVNQGPTGLVPDRASKGVHVSVERALVIGILVVLFIFVVTRLL